MESIQQQAADAVNSLDNHIIILTSPTFAHVDEGIQTELLSQIPYLKAGLRSEAKQDALVRFQTFTALVKYAHQHNALPKMVEDQYRVA